MATPIIRETDRLNFRLQPEIKDRIEKAASVSGKTMTDFAVSKLSEAADEVLENYYTAKLSNRDRELFLSVLDRAAKPNPALKRAAKTHKRLIVSK